MSTKVDNVVELKNFKNPITVREEVTDKLKDNSNSLEKKILIVKEAIKYVESYEDVESYEGFHHNGYEYEKKEQIINDLKKRFKILDKELFLRIEKCKQKAQEELMELIDKCNYKSNYKNKIPITKVIEVYKTKIFITKKVIEDLEDYPKPEDEELKETIDTWIKDFRNHVLPLFETKLQKVKKRFE